MSTTFPKARFIFCPPHEPVIIQLHHPAARFRCHYCTVKGSTKTYTLTSLYQKHRKCDETSCFHDRDKRSKTLQHLWFQDNKTHIQLPDETIQYSAPDEFPQEYMQIPKDAIADEIASDESSDTDTKIPGNPPHPSQQPPQPELNNDQTKKTTPTSDSTEYHTANSEPNESPESNNSPPQIPATRSLRKLPSRSKVNDARPPVKRDNPPPRRSNRKRNPPKKSRRRQLRRYSRCPKGRNC